MNTGTGMTLRQVALVAGITSFAPLLLGGVPFAEFYVFAKLIVPGDCEKSLLYNKLSQATPVCGRRMPLSSMTTPQSSLDLLCAWIKAGAKNN